MLVVSIQGPYSEAKKELDFALKQNADAIEFRLDLMRHLNLFEIRDLRDRCPLPVIFTLRTPSQGGAFKKNEAERKKTFFDLLGLNPDYIDIEYDSDWISMIPPEIKKIISYHNWTETPQHLEVILSRLKKWPAAVYKIATFAHSSLDSLRILAFVQRHSQVAGMCMGKAGRLTRILAPVIGSALTYTFVERKTAPGQVSFSELVTLYRYFQLNSQTKIYAVIGDPLDQSLGPLFHNQMFERFKANSVYVKIPLKRSHLDSFFSIIQDLPFAGLSVTMPLKEAVIDALQSPTLEEKNMRAVNTLIKKEEKWIGINTDGKGALNALEKKKKVAHQTVLIIGSGATAQAIAKEAAKRGAEVMISSRTFEKAQQVATQFGGKAIPSDQIATCMYDVIINATPIGMFSNSTDQVIAEKDIRAHVLALDVVIQPEVTPFLRAIQKKGGTVVLGVEMYLEQAMLQLKAWSIID